MQTTRKETVTKREVRKLKTVNGEVVEDVYNSTIDKNFENGTSAFRSVGSPNGRTGYEAITGEDLRSYEGKPSSNVELELNLTDSTRRASLGSDRSVDSRTERRSDASTPTKKSSVTLQMGSSRTSTSSISSNKDRDRQATYNISMRLGEVNGSGTDGNVYIQLFGEEGSTAKIQLRQSGDVSNKFETGELYKFTVGTVDIGKVERIKLTHDHMSYGSGFFVENVEIDVPQHDDHYHFPCNCWLSQDPKGEYVSKTIQRDQNVRPPQPTQRYTISVKLGNVENPFTKLFVRLVGDKGESSKIVLRPAGSQLEKFEDGKVYKFTVEMPGVGQVQKVHIGRDGLDESQGKGVFIEDVEVEIENGETLFFPCDSWVDDQTVDSGTELAFLPGPRPESSMVSENAHTVSVRLGEVHNPDVNLYICLIGTKGETPKVSLRPESLTLERNKTYKFTLAPTMDLGRIEKIRLGQDCRGFGNGLFVEEVEIVPPQGPPVVFPCEVWLAEDVDDGETERILFPGWTMPKKENTSYYLEFKTGDMPYAGTDANVSLQIFGEKGKTERIMLRQQKGKTLQRFHRGRTGKFTVQTMDVGKVERVRLSHDNQGENPEWYLDNLFIEVPNPQGGNDQYYFPCNTWLKGPERDRRVILELYPVSPQTKEKPQTIYTVNFRVGELTDPRTEFYLVLHGARGESGKIVLAPDDSGKFVPGQEYRVVLKSDDVGKINTIEVGQDKGNPLFVEEVEICAAEEEPVVFPLQCWVDDTEKEFHPGEIITPVIQDEVQLAPEPEPEPAIREYTISYRLGELPDSRTELYVKLYGDRGESGRLLLEPADDSRGLEEGKLYRVLVQIPDIGEIQKIHIGHGNRGPCRGLFVEEIEVSAEQGEPVIFPCRCWLAEDKGDGNVDRVLLPGETLEPLPESITYNVAFETGDLPFSGTDANVFIEIYGENGDTGKIEFNRDDNKSSGRFERGRTDKFAVETADIGKLSRIRVGHDNVGRSPEWFLKQITIDVPQRNEYYIFPYNNWIAGEDVDLDPVDEKTKGDIYTIEMKLGEVYDPVSPIYVQLIGEKGESGPIQIKPGYGPNDRFESNKTYKVVAKVGDIGKTKDVIVRQDETSTGVYIDTIEIINSRGESIVRPVKNWTSKKKDEETIGVGEGHFREGSERTSNDVAYEITFKTGDEQDAGTDADVHFQLIGDQGETEKISLRDYAMPHFETGGTDKFRVETKDVGEIKKLRVGRDNGGNHPDWLLEKVTVDDLQRNERYIFNCNSWLLGRDPEIEIEPGASATDDGRRDVHYNVTITTGNEPNAGTDANVFLQLFGELGRTEPFKLREAGDNKRFSWGRTDKFSILNKDVGKLNKVRVTRDTQGIKPGWLLEKMIIFIPETNEEYVFQCNRWIDKNEPEFDFAPGPVTDETEDNLYTVVVKVDDVMDPLSNPYYQICGVEGKTNKIYLRDGYSPQHQFKKGDTYKISVKCPDVGKVTKLIVADDGGNPGKCMYLEEITITNNNGDKTVFPSNCWLENNSRGNPVILELVPGEAASQDGVSYRMIVKTADRPNAGTDANVYFQFNGERGPTPKILLQDESGAFKRFESGRADKFIVQTVDVGKLDSMVIGHDNQGADPSWFLEEVEVDILETGDHYLFPCGRWLRAENGNNEAETTLYPGKGLSLVDEDNIGIANENLVGTEVDAPFSTSEDMEYEVEFKTGEDSGAGTDSNVFFQLFGENGETKQIELRQDKNARRFQKGNIDRFRFREIDIGKLERISVGHDGTGKSTQWFLEEVVVYVIDRNERYIFKCNRWIGGKGADLTVDSWGFYQMVGREPDIPDLLEYMQSGDLNKGIHAAVYLQHLCYQDETVKARVRKLGGIEILVRLLDHSHERIRYATACVLRNISYSTTTDENKIRIAECGGILALIRMLQRTQEEQERQVILTILRNLSGVQALRLLILRECLHILVIIILIPYSGWDKLKALREPTARDKEWSAVLEHVTRIIRNLSSAGADARDYLREEEALIDCLVWIIRVSVKSRFYENRCLENSVCTLRNLSYRLESELDRDAYKDAQLDMSSKAVKEQQSQGCFAGCGGRKKKKTSGQRPFDRQTEGVTGVELLWQPTTVGQYFLLLKESNNMETLEGSAGAIHNMTACSWNWSIKIRGDSRKAQIVPHLVRLLKRDYDPAIRAAAICLRNLAVDPENKKVIGDKAIKDLAYRIPGVNETNPLVKEPTTASLMCAIYQLCIRNEKNARLLHKTDGIRKIVRIARSTNAYSPKLVKTANQVLANLWSSRVLTEQIRKEGWDYNDDMSTEYRAAPLDFEATSLPRSPGEDSRVESDRGPPNGYTRYRTDSFDQPHRDSESHNRARVGEARTRQGSERDNPLRDRLLSDQSLNRAPPAYSSQSSFENAGYDRTPKGKRGTVNRENLEMEEYEPRSFASPARKSSSSSSQRDYNENQKAVSETPVTMNGKGSLRKGTGTGETNEKDLWV